MANRRATITQKEIARTVRGVADAGHAVGRIEVDHATGRVIVILAGAKDDGGGPNPCDRLLGK